MNKREKPGQYSIEYQSVSEWDFMISNGRDRDDIDPDEYQIFADAGDDYDKAVEIAKSRLPDSMGNVFIFRFNGIRWNHVTHDWDWSSMDRIADVLGNGTVERLEY